MTSFFTSEDEFTLCTAVLIALVASFFGLLWLRRRMHLKQPWTLDENKARIFHSNAASQGHPDATLLQKSPPSLVGSRVQLYGLKNSAELNGIHGVILRFDFLPAVRLTARFQHLACVQNRHLLANWNSCLLSFVGPANFSLFFGRFPGRQFLLKSDDPQRSIFLNVGI